MMEDNIAEVEAALIRITTEGGRGNFLIVHVDQQRNYYAQFAASPGNPRMYAELVGNSVLADADKLDAGQVAQIEAAGWQGGSPNYSKTWDMKSADFNMRSVAAEVTGLLVNVYGAAPDLPFDFETILE